MLCEGTPSQLFLGSKKNIRGRRMSWENELGARNLTRCTGTGCVHSNLLSFWPNQGLRERVYSFPSGNPILQIAVNCVSPAFVHIPAFEFALRIQLPRRPAMPAQQRVSTENDGLSARNTAQHSTAHSRQAYCTSFARG